MSDASPSTQLPKGWRRVAIKDMADSIQYGLTASAAERKDGPRFLRITDIQDGRVDWSTVPSCDVPKGQIPKYKLSSGDLVFARTGATTGKSFLIGECPEAVFASYLIRVRVSADVDSRYLSAFFQSPDYWRQIEGGKRGIGQPNVNGTVLGEVQFPLAPPGEQRQIVAEIEKQFTRLEAGVAALRRVQANLKRYRAAVLKAACEGKLVPTEAELAKNGNRKSKFETGDALLARILTERRQNWQGRGKYKEPVAPNTANLPSLPEGWMWANVEQLGDVQLGRQRSPKNVSKNYPTKYIRAANITERGIDVSDVLDMEFSPAERERFTLRDGDILLSEASGSPAHVGKPAVWRGELPLCCFQNTVLRFRPVILGSKFTLLVFQHFFVNSVFAKVAGGVGINHLGADKFSVIPFPLPPLAEQTRIVAEVERRLSVVEELESVMSANIQRATRLRQSILQRAFTGEL
jgi:type I restriction enzyme S subunit